MLDKLERIVSRASRLDDVNLRIPSQRIKVCFEQAHECYLYGFNIACAVFCRAILESALKDVVDPHLDTNRKMYAMMQRAEEIGKFTDECSIRAREVVKAGNLAAHEPELFQRRYTDERTEQILDHTRKLLEQLYSNPDAAQGGE